ncbi:MAG: DUF2283 domain-containing protein [Candidatus Bathyarchaeia archaeon]
MKVEYDKDLDIMYVRLREGKYAFSEEMNENAIIDLGDDGKILAIEILDVSKILGRELLEKMLRAEAAVLT